MRKLLILTFGVAGLAGGWSTVVVAEDAPPSTPPYTPPYSTSGSSSTSTIPGAELQTCVLIGDSVIGDEPIVDRPVEAVTVFLSCVETTSRRDTYTLTYTPDDVEQLEQLLELLSDDSGMHPQ